MNESEQQKKLDALHQKLHERRLSMSTQQTVAFFERVGILDSKGDLARQYGGPGQETRRVEKPAAQSG